MTSLSLISLRRWRPFAPSATGQIWRAFTVRQLPYRLGQAKSWVTPQLHELQVVLFHRGQITVQPRKLMPTYAAPDELPPCGCKGFSRGGAPLRRLTDRPSTVYKLGLAVRGWAWHLAR